jgi:hypothetical protein
VNLILFNFKESANEDDEERNNGDTETIKQKLIL